ncbi:MAG: arsenic efflux protein [Melioribacteraceae bacterium]|nr:arsenic efflux protein [Melioribacteraceae bacterium]
MHEHSSNILLNALTITSFVFTMMLLIEYINVVTKGSWQYKISKSKYGQYLLGVFFGIIPGCLGAYAIVSLYSHGVVGFGALVATMIATSGDEAYVMLSLFPAKAIWLFLIIAVIGFVVGITTDVVMKKFNLNFDSEQHKLEVHENEASPCFSIRDIAEHLKRITFQRALLITLLILLIGLQVPNFTGQHELSWINITLILSAIFGLFVVITVPDHFLEEHLWEHVLKKHLLKIFLWTLGALAAIHFLEMFFDLSQWIESNLWIVLIVAVIIGVIPESGPHLVFITLFVSGTIPFSILIASSIVQDGHGTIPLLALSKKSFMALKAINLVVGFVVGAVGLVFY